jgi:hypothetical protein
MDKACLPSAPEGAKETWLYQETDYRQKSPLAILKHDFL